MPEVSSDELEILAYAEQKARDDGECAILFTEGEDGGVTVADVTEHLNELENQ